MPRVFTCLFSVALTQACAPTRVTVAPVRPPAAASKPQPALVCTYTYGGESQRLSVPPTRDPYRVRAQNVEDRFEFKVVYLAAPAEVASVSVYTYSPGPDAPILIHEAKYGLPCTNHGRHGFTGLQLLYDPRGREFEYYCEWLER